MGWWNAKANGASLQSDDTGILWGDGPADLMGDAVDRIVEEFERCVERRPTKVELRAGLEFTLGAYDE